MVRVPRALQNTSPSERKVSGQMRNLSALRDAIDDHSGTHGQLRITQMFAMRLPQRGIMFRLANFLLAFSVIGGAAIFLTGAAGLNEGLIYLNVPKIESAKDAFLSLRLRDADGRMFVEPERTAVLINATGRLYDAKGATAFATCSSEPLLLAPMKRLDAPGLPADCTAWTTGAVLLPAQVISVDSIDVTFLSGDKPVADVSELARFAQVLYTFVPAAIIFVLFLTVQYVGFLRLLSNPSNRAVLYSTLLASILLFYLYWSHPRLGISPVEFVLVLGICSVFLAATIVGLSEAIVTSLNGRSRAGSPLKSPLSHAWMDLPLYWLTAGIVATCAIVGIHAIWQGIFLVLRVLAMLLGAGWLKPILDVIFAWTIW